jgi:predicted regulator of Ras-like GTPase activity (Roadblock/LC7/MglB family)
MNSGSDHIAFLGAEDVRELEALLAGFLVDARARCALLCDRTGRLLTGAGDMDGLDQTTFASLAAGDFAASDQLAAHLGESEFASLYHHGRAHSMFLADVGGTVILAVLFDQRTTLGMIRVRTRQVVPACAAVFAQIRERGPRGNLVQLESEWASEAEVEIDRLFGE